MNTLSELMEEAQKAARQPGADFFTAARSRYIPELIAALAAIESKSTVEWGVQVGTWPTPTRYQTLELAQYYADHPFKGLEKHTHIAVTRKVLYGPWEVVQS